jgi:hypothetical protein
MGLLMEHWMVAKMANQSDSLLVDWKVYLLALMMEMN